MAASSENSHYNPKQDVHMISDAFRSGLGAALEQNTSTNGYP